MNIIFLVFLMNNIVKSAVCFQITCILALFITANNRGIAKCSTLNYQIIRIESVFTMAYLLNKMVLSEDEVFFRVLCNH